VSIDGSTVDEIVLLCLFYFTDYTFGLDLVILAGYMDLEIAPGYILLILQDAMNTSLWASLRHPCLRRPVKSRVCTHVLIKYWGYV